MGATTTDTIQPRIYVACLAAYNSGYLHGAWINADQEPWAIWEEVRAMLAASPIIDAEEHAIHDYEGFAGVQIGECEGLEEVSNIAQFLREFGPLGAAVLNYLDCDLDEAREALAERYLGCHDCLADYVQELTEETTRIPQSLRYYIDWQAMARDAELSGDLFTICTGMEQVHVFAGR
ncbi:MAG: antirestriction protein ArdA [Pseudomonadota bacterium]